MLPQLAAQEDIGKELMAKKVTIEWELEHCPFCGEEDNLEIDESGDQWTVRCQNCHCEGPNRDSYNKTVEAWNTRF